MDNQNNAAHSTANIYNPLIEAAKPVFILVNAMQQTTSQLSTDSLINKFSLLINNFEENAEKNGIGTHGEYNLTSDMTENLLREEHRCIGSACGMYKEEQFYYRIAHNTFMLNQFLATPTKTMKGGK